MLSLSLISSLQNQYFVGQVNLFCRHIVAAVRLAIGFHSKGSRIMLHHRLTERYMAIKLAAQFLLYKLKSIFLFAFITT